MSCGETFTKGGMSGHLKSCSKRAEADAASGSAPPARLLHIVAEDRYGAGYWLHLEVPEFATLGILDRYLRDIWLECCGHLSEFEIEGERYSWIDEEDMGFGFLMDSSASMHETELSSVMSTGTRFRHSYDFGSTTELKGRVLAEREGRVAAEPAVKLLARNLAPEYVCGECGKPAVWLCQQCAWEEGGGLYCDECGQAHDCEWGGWEMLLPLVNSPRTGVCAYTGGPLT
jgi:predicted RNA-binding Zn-ribbon protein involved in translation (DUF1610 family)